MKPKNFPARKLRRQLNAIVRDTGRPAITPDAGSEVAQQLQAARAICTKKRRANV